MTIPRGRRVRIFNSEVEIVDSSIPLVLEEDLTMSLRSNFSSLMDSGPPNDLVGILGNLSSSLTGIGFSGAFKQAGFQIWKGTQPLQISFNIGLYMKTNAYKDVIEPAKALMRIPLPIEGGGLGLTPPGPSILEVFSENGISRGQEVSSGKNLSMFIGNTIWMKKMIVTSVEPTFSAETDEDDYPIWCKLKIDISSIYTATSNMVDTYIGVDTSSQERE